METQIEEALNYINAHEYEKAFVLLEKEAEQSARAQYNLAVLYFQGKGTDPSLIKALKYANLAHQNGYSKAPNLLNILQEKQREVAFIKEAIFSDLEKISLSTLQREDEIPVEEVVSEETEEMVYNEDSLPETFAPLESEETLFLDEELSETEEESVEESLDGDEIETASSPVLDEIESEAILADLEGESSESDLSEEFTEISESEMAEDIPDETPEHIDEPEPLVFETVDEPLEAASKKPVQKEAENPSEEIVLGVTEVQREDTAQGSPDEELVFESKAYKPDEKVAEASDTESDGKRNVRLNVADKFITLQVIFIFAFLVVLGVAYFFFSETKSSFESFKREEIELLNQSNIVTRGLSEFKTLVLIASLRKGDDYMEMQKMNRLSEEMSAKIFRIKKAAQVLNDQKLEQLGDQLNTDYERFVALALMMPDDFKTSFEEGIDTLGAVDSVNGQLMKVILQIEERIHNRTDEKTVVVSQKLDDAMLDMLIIGGVATLISLLIYLSSSQLRRLNKTLDLMVEERTNELNSTLTLLKAYTDAIDHSVIMCKFDYLGAVLDVNNHFCKVSGYAKNELTGKSMAELNIYDEETYPSRYRRWGEILKDLIDLREWSGVLIFRAKNGRNFYVQTTISPIESGEGEVIEFLALMQDITKLEENRLEQLSESVDMALDIKLDQFIEYIPHPTVALNRNSVVTEFNEGFKELFDFIEDEAVLEVLPEEKLVFDSLMQKEEGCVYPEGSLNWKETLLELGMDEEQKVCLLLGGEKKIFHIMARRLDMDDEEKTLLSLAG